MKLSKLVSYLDARLSISEIEDYPNALNGLQLENRGGVTRIAAAVDACESVIDAAVEAGCDLLLVHHGLFWSGAQCISGAQYRKLERAISAGLAIYSAHLPLDVHPDIGNNVLLAKALGIKKPAETFDFGVRAKVRMTLRELIDHLEAAVDGPVHWAPGGPDEVRNLGIITGGAGERVTKAAAAGIDTFITGEGSHWTYTAAEELGVNLIYGGHYATETFGVKALAQEVAEKFDLPWTFLDHPTGL